MAPRTRASLRKPKAAKKADTYYAETIVYFPTEATRGQAFYEVGVCWLRRKKAGKQTKRHKMAGTKRLYLGKPL